MGSNIGMKLPASASRRLQLMPRVMAQDLLGLAFTEAAEKI